MRAISVLLFAIGAQTLALSMPAQACTYSIAKEARPQAIKRRSDVRKVSGHFYVDRVVRIADNAVIRGTVFGHVVTAKGETISTNHEWNEPAIACEFYSKPLANADGRFFIRKPKKNGSFEMLVWEGQYVDKNPEFEIPTLLEEVGK